ncbi:hypothetical protein [Lysobacter humi (ex Lee et al. 2017)]
MDLPQPPRRTPTHRPSALTIRAALRGLVLCIALVPVLGACAGAASRFDSEAWKAQRGVPDARNRRNDMAVAARARLHVGMTRAQVIELLGDPDSRKTGGIEVYALGASPLGIDPQYLELTYRDGRLAAFAITEA